MNLAFNIIDGEIGKLNYKGQYYKKNLTQYFTSEKIDEKILREPLIEEQCKLIHGAVVQESEEYIRVYNDPFCSHPIYITTIYPNTLMISTQFSEVYKCGANLNVDGCGVYELMWGGVGQFFYDRTIFKEVKQLPAASFCEIEKKTMKYQICPYWNFDILEDETIDTQKKAVDLVYEQMTKIYDQYKDKAILMGLSGGLDSRLSAGLLGERMDVKKSIFFTFGYNKHILEYTFAKRVSKKLNLPEPMFIKLDEKDYENAKEVAEKTGCHVGMHHGHTYVSLQRIDKKEEMIYVSNYYSDAVMGWDARKEKNSDEKLKDLAIYKRLYENKDKLPVEAADEIIEDAVSDLRNIVNRWNREANFSCFEEFFYVVERNTKFHLRSAYQCNDVIRTDIPFADFNLLRLCISIPLKYRWEKKIERELIKQYYFDEKDISSRRYFERSRQGEQEYSFKEKIYYYSGGLILRGINLLNLILARLSNNRVQVVNPYQTENQRIVFDRYFKQDFLRELEEVMKHGLISEECYLELKKDNFRSNNVGLKFSIIGLGKCINDIKNSEKKGICGMT